MSVRWTGLLLCALLLCGVTSHGEAGEVSDRFKALQAEKDPAKRIAMIPDIARINTDGAARALAHVLRHDAEASVRIAAARGLSEVKAKAVTGVILTELRYGNTLEVREALSQAMRRHAMSEQLIWASEQPAYPTRERARVIDAMGYVTDADTRDKLFRIARGNGAALRAAAIRAVARRSDSAPQRLRLFVELLRRDQDRDVVLTALDVVGPFVHPVMRPALKRLTSHADREVVAAAKHALDHLTHAEAKKAAAEKAGKAGEGDRYDDPDADEPKGGDTKPPADSPPVRTRIDVVWVLDVTGSTGASIGRMRTRIGRHLRTLGDPTRSVRIGIVLFRGGHAMHAIKKGISTMPLTFDRNLIASFLSTMRASGVDDRGSAIPVALHTALDQMGWRTNATREVRMILDGGCKHPDRAKEVADRHFRSDATRTFITCTPASRTATFPGLNDIARLGGTGQAVIER